MGRQFVIVTRDFSGLGFAKKLKEEGETVTLAGENPEEKPDDKKMWDQVATDWIPRMSLSEAMRKLRTDSTYWIFTENNYPDEADTLRLYGQKVFGTGELSDRMEHERGYACDIAEQYGLLVPETYQCSTREEGLAYLDANPDKAYVFKPDDSGGANFTTFVPMRREDEDANRETYTYLEQMKDEPGSYVLQERVFGVEVDLELWLYEGKPVMAYATLEAKRKNAHGLGEMAGCSGDFCWVVPVDAPLVDYTIGKMLPFYQDEQYTGLADVNVVLTAKGPVFLEACDRFGYNSHVTLFLGLALDNFGDIMADFMDGKIDHFPDRFSPEIGASITVFLDHPRPGMPLHIDERWKEQYYPFDGYLKDDTMLLSGYSSELGIFVEYGTSIKDASDRCLDKLLRREAVSVPDMHYRVDLGESDYPGGIVARYTALNDQWGHSMRIVGGTHGARR